MAASKKNEPVSLNRTNQLRENENAPIPTFHVLPLYLLNERNKICETTEIYVVAQEVPADEYEYDHINRNKGIPRNGASTSQNIVIKSTDGKKETPCNLINSAFILALFSLLVGVVAVCLVFVFNMKSNNDLQNPAATNLFQQNLTQRISNVSTILKQQIVNATKTTDQQIETVIATTNKQMANVTTAFNKRIANITTSFQKQITIATRRFDEQIANITTKLKQERNQTFMDLKRVESNITDVITAMMKQETNKLSITLSIVEQNISTIQLQQQSLNQQLHQVASRQLRKIQELQNYINLLLHNHPPATDTQWLALSNGFQYRRTERKQNWENARRSCKNLGGDLASVRISKDAVRTFLLSQFLTKNNDYWIGLKDSGNDNWNWITGDELINTSIWSEGEPNNSGSGEDCAVLVVKNSVEANDENCFRSFYGICEKPGNS